MSSNPSATTERQISHEKFGQLDENGDGFISKNEFRNSLKKQGLFKSEDAVDAAWSHFDKNTDGRISFGGEKQFSNTYIFDRESIEQVLIVTLGKEHTFE